MARSGFVRLKKEEPGRLIPKAPYSDIALVVPLRRNRNRVATAI
jgi:predicted transcriptional regulator